LANLLLNFFKYSYANVTYLRQAVLQLQIEATLASELKLLPAFLTDFHGKEFQHSAVLTFCNSSVACLRKVIIIPVINMLPGTWKDILPGRNILSPVSG